MLTRPITRPLTRPITRALVRRSSAFDPLTLFAQGQQGAWYDPSDLATLFQDSAGTTPVTADGDPVGLMLDKRLGLVRGPEQSANPGPDYASLTGFTATNGNLSIVDGHVRLTGNGGISRVTISETLTVGKTYNVMIRARSSSPGARMFFWSGVEPSIDSGVGSIGSEFSDFSCIVKATSENVDVRAYIDTSSATAGYTLDIASISIKELPGNHASQSTTAAKPAYRTDGTLHWLEGDGVDDFIGTGIVPYDGNQVFLSTAFQQVAGGSRFGGLYRFLREGGSPTGISDNFLEEYHDSPSDFFRKTLTQRYPSGITLLSKVKYPTDFSSFISWFKNNQDGWAEQVIGQGSGIETKPTLSLGAGNATLEIFRGYAGAMIKGSFFGQIWVSGAISDEAISKANRYLAEKSGVTLP